jgi:hypothetical protein
MVNYRVSGYLVKPRRKLASTITKAGYVFQSFGKNQTSYVFGCGFVMSSEIYKIVYGF